LNAYVFSNILRRCSKNGQKQNCVSGKRLHPRGRHDSCVEKCTPCRWRQMSSDVPRQARGQTTCQEASSEPRVFFQIREVSLCGTERARPRTHEESSRVHVTLPCAWQFWQGSLVTHHRRRSDVQNASFPYIFLFIFSIIFY